MKRLLIFLIRCYQRVISPLLPASCKYEPTCSAYAAEAFRKKGFFRGLALSVWRILRCNPFSKGGYDPVDGPRERHASPQDSHGAGGGGPRGQGKPPSLPTA